MIYSLFFDTTSFKPARLCWNEGEPRHAGGVQEALSQLITNELRQLGFQEIPESARIPFFGGLGIEKDSEESKAWEHCLQYSMNNWVVMMRGAEHGIHLKLRSLQTGQDVQGVNLSLDDALSLVGLYINKKHIRDQVGGACGVGGGPGGPSTGGPGGAGAGGH